MAQPANPHLKLHVYLDEAQPEKISGYQLTVGDELSQIIRMPQPINPRPFLDEMVALQEAEERQDAHMLENLEDLGDYLFLKLLPEPIRQRLWDERFGEPSLVIVLDQELFVPWELMRLFNPKNNDEKGDFLGTTFAMARMVFDDPHKKLPGHLPPGQMSLAMGGIDGLRWVKKEMESLCKCANVAVDRIETKFDFKRQLLRRGSSIWHYVGHAQRYGDFGSTLEFVDGSFHLTDLGVGSGIFAQTRPFVFLNACQSGKAVNGLIGCDSWATGFLSKGATGFLGAQWNVNDQAACLFASEFYGSFFAGDTLGHAVMRSRVAGFAKAPFSSLAYALYGNPNTQLGEEPDEDLEEFWETLSAENDWDALHQPLLGVLTALKEPVPLEFLGFFNESISPAELVEWYQTWGRFLLRTDDREWGLMIQPDPKLRTKVQLTIDLTDTHRQIASTLEGLA